MSDEQPKPEEQKAPEAPKRYVHVIVSHEKINGLPSGFEMAVDEIPEEIKKQVTITLTDKGGKLNVDIEK